MEPIDIVENVHIPPDDPFKPFRDALARLYKEEAEDLARLQAGVGTSPDHETDDGDSAQGYSYLETAHIHVKQGAVMPSPSKSCAQDLTAEVPGLNVVLWPHQLAAIGRLHTILKSHKAALLALDMGLGKSFVAVGMRTPLSEQLYCSLTLTRFVARYGCG